MYSNYTVQPQPEDQFQDDDQVAVPDYEREFVTAKSFLQKASPFSGDNL